MSVKICCSVTSCWYNICKTDPLSLACIYHYQMRTAKLGNIYCDISACVNKTRSTTLNEHCSKHYRHDNACCSTSCTMNRVEGQFYCLLHSHIVVCLLSQCCSTDVGFGNVYCHKHKLSIDSCNAIGCDYFSCPYSDFCLYHYKLGRLCEVEGCFTTPRRKTIRFCVRHDKDPFLCIVRKCKRVRIDDNTMCRHHNRLNTLSDEYLGHSGISVSGFDDILILDSTDPLSGTFQFADPCILTNLF